ncbi:MAG TPA: SusC/RagA family TonB-linked outer membrane protein [Puia sp.]|nr:SusC/RagA family TonB-linked outer membrane protein [Puia sp.]
MKLTALLLIFTGFQAFSKGFSQDRINITLRDVQLKYAITYIQQTTKYRFIYNDDLVPQNKSVSIDAKEATIEEVLNILFQSTNLRYHVMDNNLIVISEGDEKKKEQILVNGTIHLHNNDGTFSIRGGISVIEKGTNNGTITDDKGRFSLSVHDENSILIISSVGYSPKEVPITANAGTIEITLEASATEMQNVVVTALGVTRQKKSLTYATQTLPGTELSNTRDLNLSNALDGRVAGLTINKTNAGPGSSSRIIFRGNRSITGNNQPLIVVDGVRVDNTANAFTDVTANIAGTRDNGDGISNINPDDIESVTVLTGASAAALYGSDASNGAILITTKKGRSGSGVGVQLSSSVVLDNPMILPKSQNVYGQGQGGVFIANSLDSWGPKMEGQEVQDWTGKTQALSPQPDNIKDFFQTGTELINTISLSAGNEKSQTYFSYTNNYSTGIMPNNTYKRNNLNLRQTNQLTSKLSMDLKANYIEEDIENRPMAGAGNYALATIYSMPRSLRLSDIKNYESINPTDLSLSQNYWATPTPNFQNPYWSAYRNLYDRTRNRFLGLASLKYQITPEFSIQARTSLDYYSDYSQEMDYSGSYWITFAGQGNYIVNKSSTRQFNNDLLLNYTKNLSDAFHLNVLAGASLEQFNFQSTNSNDQGLTIANFFTLSNGLATLSTNSLSRTEKQSIYADVNISYKNYLFLEVTGRNDWNSTLPVNNASYFFPSIGGSAILNDALNLPKTISLLKVRTSYALVGNGTGFNQLKSSPTFGPGGNGGFLYVDRVLHDADLKPEQTKSFEAGVDFGFFKNRLGGEFTFYKTNTINQILQIGVPNPSGYAFRIINAGNIQNQGVEIQLFGKPVETKNFNWTITFNFGLNRNKIIYLDSLQKSPPLSSPETLGSIVADEGKSYGDIYTTSFMRNSSGQILVDTSGKPLVQTDQTKHYAGNSNPLWTAGMINTFQYKNWTVSFLIDMRKGGIVVSGTQALMASKGTSELTVANRETGFIVPNSVMQDGSKNTKVISVEDYWRWVGSDNLVGEAFTYDATNIRLREASISYNFSKIINGSFIKGATLTLLGRNLFFFKNNAYGFDPESALSTGNNQGLEYTSVPSTRSYGLYLKLNF